MSLSPSGPPPGASSVRGSMRPCTRMLCLMWQGFVAARELAEAQMAAQPGLSQPRLP